MSKSKFPFVNILAVPLALFAVTASANVSVQVVDSTGQPVQNAVVYLDNGSSSTTKTATAQIEQKNKQFAPLVTVVQTGTAVSFPNNDTVRHHVYSFSPAMKFELKLYAGKPEAPKVFNKAGTVVLGCNIHDNMLAYVEVVDTPYFAKTDALGKAKFPTVASGKYTLKTWHYQQAAASPSSDQIVNVKNDEGSFVVKLNFKSDHASSTQQADPKPDKSVDDY